MFMFCKPKWLVSANNVCHISDLVFWEFFQEPSRHLLFPGQQKTSLLLQSIKCSKSLASSDIPRSSSFVSSFSDILAFLSDGRIRDEANRGSRADDICHMLPIRLRFDTAPEGSRSM